MVNGAVPNKLATRMRVGDHVRVEIATAKPLEVVAEAIPLDIYFEDAHLIVINKPAGMVVHPAPGHTTGTLVNALLHHCHDLSGIGGVMRPGIVHRLDKDTSGLIVVSKHDAAHQGLADMFAAKSRGEAGSLARRYLALCAPGPRREVGRQGIVRTLYGRHPVHRKLFSSKVLRGKPAVSHWQLVEALPAAALLEFTLQTGRTHQIRVHAADHGFPVFGDTTYGYRQRDERLAELASGLGRQALHAHVLEFQSAAARRYLACAGRHPHACVRPRALRQPHDAHAVIRQAGIATAAIGDVERAAIGGNREAFQAVELRGQQCFAVAKA
jgi:23S rRNA pseudouridine1911/1915/1917 synthase